MDYNFIRRTRRPWYVWL